METVDEFQQNKGKIKTASALRFPNVQSCVAYIAQKPKAMMVGAHLTIHEKNTPTDLGTELVDAFKGCRTIYCVGGIKTGVWSDKQIEACCGTLNVRIYVYDTTALIDLKSSSGGVTVITHAGGSMPAIFLAKKTGGGTRLKAKDFRRI